MAPSSDAALIARTIPIKTPNKAELFIADALDAKKANIGAKAAAAVDRSWRAKILTDIPDYHLTPVEDAMIAKNAQVKKQVFYHVISPPADFIIKHRYPPKTNRIPTDYTIFWGWKFLRKNI